MRSRTFYRIASVPHSRGADWQTSPAHCAQAGIPSTCWASVTECGYGTWLQSDGWGSQPPPLHWADSGSPETTGSSSAALPRPVGEQATTGHRGESKEQRYTKCNSKLRGPRGRKPQIGAGLFTREAVSLRWGLTEQENKGNQNMWNSERQQNLNALPYYSQEALENQISWLR